MKQRIKIKQYKKQLNKNFNFVTKSFQYGLNYTDYIDNTSLKIWYEYFQDLKNLGRILRNKQLHIIKNIMYQNYKYDNIPYNFDYLLNDIESLYEIAFDDKEIYNYSKLLRQPILKPLKQKKIKQYTKTLHCLLSFYKKRIKAIKNTLAYTNLVIDLNIINTLIQQNRIKELNIIIEENFKSYLDDLISWYLYEFDDKYNTIIYDYNLRKIKL